MDIGPEIISDDWPKSWSPMRQRANDNEHELALAARRRRPANPQHSRAAVWPRARNETSATVVRTRVYERTILSLPDNIMKNEFTSHDISHGYLLFITQCLKHITVTTQRSTEFMTYTPITASTC